MSTAAPEAPRFTGSNNDILRPPYADLPPLSREQPVLIAVIADEALTPIGNTSEENIEAMTNGRKGFELKTYPPFTDPRYPVPDSIIKEMTGKHAVLGRLLKDSPNPDWAKKFILREFLQEEGNEDKAEEMYRKVELPPQVRSVVAGTIKDFNAREKLKGVLPDNEIVDRMEPYANYAVYTGVGAAKKVVSSDGRALVIPRVGSDGEVDKKFSLTINSELVSLSRVGIWTGCGFGGGDVSAEVWELLVKGKIPNAAHMMRELIDRAPSQLAKALNIHGGAEANVGACASAGKAGVNAFRAIMAGDVDVAFWNATEGVINRPIGAASFDTMSALDRGLDPMNVSLSMRRDRRGFIMADGSGTIILADPEWARRNGIPVLYHIIGYGNTSDAGDDTRPNGKDGERALRMSRRRAEMQGKIEGRFIESGHYTATPTGDGIEFLHTQNAYEDLTEAKRITHHAGKALIGHLLGAAGMAAQLAIGWALQRKRVWGTPHGGELMDEAYGADVPQETRDEPDLTDGSSKTFGFGGANVAVNSRVAR